MFHYQYHFSENRGVYERMWKSMVQTDRPQMTIHNTPQTLCMPET